ncbi:MAG: protein kinase, partial [Planctomycetota bacterium]
MQQPRPGERLGGWLLERQLGAGGMGAVFVGVAPTGARRAIKVPFFEPHELDRKERFARENEALAKVPPHAGVLRIHSAGVDRGFAFAVLELVEGKPLDALIGSGLGTERALELAVAITRALEHVHAAGIVHRDLKPA